MLREHWHLSGAGIAFNGFNASCSRGLDSPAPLRPPPNSGLVAPSLSGLEIVLRAFFALVVSFNIAFWRDLPATCFGVDVLPLDYFLETFREAAGDPKETPLCLTDILPGTTGSFLSCGFESLTSDVFVGFGEEAVLGFRCLGRP